MEKPKEVQTDYIYYPKNQYVSQAALYADQNFPSRKYMEDGLKKYFFITTCLKF